ncbi:SH3 domain-containing protein [Clostridium tarantellae]|uniref:SH3 domain-containing protein n=1 Tax=Clostridium tarantellae TaxID=39493 RepID=A0A6I1MK33_9CLOT|nr:SH3 domain-containing protein [Clostridium tarantellae]MPQ43380.1 SH3 domain-containing protein [Clostridium tarantellae]
MKRKKINKILLAGCITANLALLGGQKVLATTKEMCKDQNSIKRKENKAENISKVEKTDKKIIKEKNKENLQKNKVEEKVNNNIVSKDNKLEKKVPNKKEVCKKEIEKKEQPKKEQKKEELKEKVVKCEATTINGIKINKQLISRNYSKGVHIVPKYIVIHDTDNRDRGANAIANRGYFANHPEAKASTHYIVDQGNVVQALEDNWRGWHIGDGHNPNISNSNTIGIELCVNRGNDFNRTLENGIALTKYLMKKYNIPASHVVRHHDCSGKICPKMMMEDRPDLWPYFKARVSGSSDPIPSATSSSIATGNVINISSTLNVRAGANLDASVISHLTNDQYVNIYGESNGWYKIDYLKDGNRKYGYVSKNYIKVIKRNNGDNKESIQHNNAINKEGQVCGISTSLNVRSGASINNSITSSLRNNEKIYINYEENGWYNITFGKNEKGFVKKDYVKVLKNKKSVKDNNTSPKIEKNNKKGIVVVSSSLNLRKGPGINYSVINYLPNNKEVEILGENENWYKIRVNGEEGYVSMKYIKVISNNSSNKETKPSNEEKPKAVNEIGTVIVSSSLNVRSGAGTNYGIIDSLIRNKKVEILENTGEWYKIRFDGKEGYVAKRYIKVNEEKLNVSSNSYKLGTVINVKSNLNVRKGPGCNYLVKAYLLPSAEVKIKSENNGWYNIIFNTISGEKEGFVKNDYIKVK